MSNKDQPERKIVWRKAKQGFFGFFVLFLFWRVVAHPDDVLAEPWENIFITVVGSIFTAGMLLWFENYGAKYPQKTQKIMVAALFVVAMILITVFIFLFPN